MSPTEIEALIHDTIESLPGWARDSMQGVAVVVREEADYELDPDSEGLLGLYTGVPLPERESGNAGELPDLIYIFRRPHLERGLSPAALREELVTTFLHELGHYSGFDDERLEELGWG